MLTSILDSKKVVPVCYHPMTVVFVDDDQDALANISLLLQGHFPCKTFSKPLEALDFLNNQYKEGTFATRCYTPEPESGHDVRLTGIDFRKFSEEVYRPKRFEQIAVVIIDYAMPEMTGLEFSRQLKNKWLKPIMLTGEASNETALQAFNQREIYQYIRKDQDAELIQSSLLQWITDVQKSYFISYSVPAITSLVTDPERPITTLTDPAYYDLVYSTLAERRAVEFYVTEALGSIVMFDKNGTPSWLAICDEEETHSLIERASMEDAPADIIKAIKSKEKIPYFFTDKEYYSSPKDWGRYLHPAKSLKGESNYLYALITDPKAYPLENKIISFNDYVEST